MSLFSEHQKSGKKMKSIKGSVMKYEWGKIGSSSAVARLAVSISFTLWL